MNRIGLTAAFLLSTAPAFAADHTWNGTVSDAMCGANHKAMGNKLADRDCTLACTKGGPSFALVSGGKVYKLSGHEDDLKTNAGHVVTITGELKDDTIKVSKIETPKK
jgi:hypothetical protein